MLPKEQNGLNNNKHNNSGQINFSSDDVKFVLFASFEEIFTMQKSQGREEKKLLLYYTADIVMNQSWLLIC